VKKKVSFLVFFLLWAERMKWDVPDIHIQACIWLESKGTLAVLRCFRGFGKSTILAVYNAWRYYKSDSFRILHQSESDKTAYKTSRDTQNVLRRHPLTRGMLPEGQGTVEQWWVTGAVEIDSRNASMYAKGILSNVTSARADECQNDDVEVPRNIVTPEAREKLRYRLGEQVHILVPGGSRLFIGTPHTHDSLYDEMEALGADCLTIRMFEREHRIDNATKAAYDLPFVPEYVFFGIGKKSRLMVKGKDYRLQGTRLVFASAPGGLVDCYAGCAWPERFDRDELEKRRRETRTINEFDSQYSLHSKPVHEIRLDPAKLIPYDVKPRIETANKETMLMLGKVRIVGAAARWDCALGKLDTDASAFSGVFTDARGQLYWQFAEGMTGDIDAQCQRVRALVIENFIPRVTVETNGIGGFVAAILRKHLAGQGIHGRVQSAVRCAVVEDFAVENKNKRILDAFEAPMSSGFLWAHVSVTEGPTWDQMKDFNPDLKKQPDDYLDSGAGAISETPIRIGRAADAGQASKILESAPRDNWRPNTGSYEVTLES